MGPPREVTAHFNVTLRPEMNEGVEEEEEEEEEGEEEEGEWLEVVGDEDVEQIGFETTTNNAIRSLPHMYGPVGRERMDTNRTVRINMFHHKSGRVQLITNRVKIVKFFNYRGKMELYQATNFESRSRSLIDRGLI